MSDESTPLIHPGEILREVYLEPLKLSAVDLAQTLGLSRPTIEGLAQEKRGISVKTAVRLARYFRTSPAFWLNMQQAYDLEMFRRSEAQAEVNKIVPWQVASIDPKTLVAHQPDLTGKVQCTWVDVYYDGPCSGLATVGSAPGFWFLLLDDEWNGPPPCRLFAVYRLTDEQIEQIERTKRWEIEPPGYQIVGWTTDVGTWDLEIQG